MILTNFNNQVMIAKFGCFIKFIFRSTTIGCVGLSIIVKTDIIWYYDVIFKTFHSYKSFEILFIFIFIIPWDNPVVIFDGLIHYAKNSLSLLWKSLCKHQQNMAQIRICFS